MRLNNQNLPAYLAARGLLTQPDAALVEEAGDGNINFVRRVRAQDGTTLVVKQARDALERFPEYRVTTERIVFERRYLRHAAELAGTRADVLPDVVDFDADARVLVLEDLGELRLDTALESGPPPRDALTKLGEFLGAVHERSRPRAAELDRRFQNGEMRELHGEHIFTLPYELGAFPLSDSLRKTAEGVLARPGVRRAIASLRDRYYASGDALIHADPQPGNVLLQSGRPRLIDAEIAHVGDPAFDLGTALAHLYIHGLARDDASDPGEALAAGYLAGGGRPADVEQAQRYAGVEMLRRTIGAARLPVLESQALSESVLQNGAARIAG